MHFSPGLRLRIALAFIVFSIIVLVSIGLAAYFDGRSSLENAAISELQTTVLEKQAALDGWIKEAQFAITRISVSPALLNQVAAFVSTSDTGNRRQAQNAILAELHPHAGAGQEFLDLLIIEPNQARVIQATDPSEIGKLKETFPYFIHGLEGPYVQNVYYSPQTQAAAMTASAPLRSPDGQLLGVLAGRLDMKELSQIISRNTGLHETDDFYLVTEGRLFATQPRFISDSVILRKGIHTVSVDHCLAGNSGAVFDSDYLGTSVISVYQWLPEDHLCLIGQIEQAEAVRPVYSFGNILLAVGVLVFGFALALALFLAQTMIRPVLALKNGAERFGQGELEIRLPVTSHDELGALAQTFNAMAGSLADKERRLREYADQLERLVVERTAALQASEAELRAIFAAMTDAILIWNAQGECLKVAPTFQGLVSNGAGGLLGKKLGALFSLEQSNEFMNSIQQALDTQQTVTIEYSQVSDGQEVWFLTTISPMLENTVVWVAHDITERKREEIERNRLLIREQAARQQAEAAQQRLSFLAEASALMADSLDIEISLGYLAQLAVRYFADWCAVHSVADDETVRELAVACTDPMRFDAAHNLQRLALTTPDAAHGVYRVIRTGKAEFYAEIQPSEWETDIADSDDPHPIVEPKPRTAIIVPMIAHERTVGTITFVSIRENRLYDDDDRALAQDLAARAALATENARLYAASRDLNQELELRVDERTAQLTTAIKELEAFSYSVSHDLRTPLRAIDGFSQALVEDYAEVLDSRGQNYLNRVRTATQRMSALIDDLLQLSRLTRGEVHRSPVDLSALAHEINSDISANQPERDVEFRCEDGLMVSADKGLMRAVLLNLLGNAWKFTSKKGHALIEVGRTQQNGKPSFFVRDNGAGFDMAHAGKLFGAFQRLHRIDEFEGNGIGLATVQRIIHRHGGEIWAEGQVDRGATFYFTL